MSNLKFTTDILIPILQQERRRLFASLGHILTTSIATSIVAGLFVYIFGDFLQVKLPHINKEFADLSWSMFLYLLILVWSIVNYRWIQSVLFQTPNWFSAIHNFGTSNLELKKHRQIFALISASSSQTLLCVLLSFAFSGFNIYHYVFAGFLAIGSSFSARKPASRIEEDQKTAQSCQDTTKSPLLAWRKTRVITNSWPGSSLRILGSLPFILGSIVLAMGHPAALSQLCVLLGGVVFSWIVPMLVAEDLESTWIERQAAVSHDQWIQAWQQLFTQWAKTLFVTVFLMSFIVSMATSQSLNLTTLDLSLHASNQSLTLGFLASFPIWLAPSLVMQIDGQRIMTNILMLTLVNIFIGTTVMAAPIAFILVPLLHREAHRYQGGRFARGSHH